MGGNLVNGPHVATWVAERIKGHACPEHSVAIGLQVADEIVAGVLYENWNGKSIVAHMAIDGIITPGFVAAIFDYAYHVCNVAKVMLPISSANVKCHTFVEHMGFREEARIKDAAPDGDIVIYTLAKCDCRFLEDKYRAKLCFAV